MLVNMSIALTYKQLVCQHPAKRRFVLTQFGYLSFLPPSSSINTGESHCLLDISNSG